jgi:hypothetical protein
MTKPGEAGQGAVRRRFLGLIGAAAGTAATSAAALNADGSRGAIPSEPEGDAERRKARYRETDHVRAFYQTNRT